MSKEVTFLDIDDVETIRNALNKYRPHQDVDTLLEIFPAGEQKIYDTERPFDNFANHFKHTLRKALINYRSQIPAPKDLLIAIELLSALDCKEHSIRTMHVILSDMGETTESSRELKRDSHVSTPFEFDFEFCTVCERRQYKGEVKPYAVRVSFLEGIAEQGSYTRSSEHEVRESMVHPEFEQTVKEIKDALGIK